MCFLEIEIHCQLDVSGANLQACVDFPAPKSSQGMGNGVILLLTCFSHFNL